MNRPIVMAQLGGSTAVQNVRVIKLAKPADGQAQTVYLGYDQKIKLDLSGIANEKITIVHIGERAVILFDNQSTLTIEPFFDSTGAGPRADLSFDVNGRTIDPSQFAATFPVTTDQSILPALGDGTGGTPASGANFRSASVDPFVLGNPLDLLGQEELGNFVTEEIVGQNQQADVKPTGGSSISLLVDDQNLLTGSTPNAPVTAAGALSFAAGTDAITSFAFGSTAGLSPSLNWALSANGTVLTGSDERGAVVRLTINAPGSIAANSSGTVTVNVQLLINFDTHPGLNVDDLFNLGSVTVVATDVSGDTAAGTVAVGVSDDVPHLTNQGPVILHVDEDGLVGANLDNNRPGEANFGGQTAATFNIATLFAVGADQPGTFQFTSGAVAALNALGLTSAGVPITHTLVNGVITGSAGGNPIYTITLTAAGQLSVQLLDQIDHADNPNDTETNLSINLGGVIQVVDSDGDTLSTGAANIVLRIGDDIPFVITDREGGFSFLALDEDALAGANTDSGNPNEANFGGAASRTVNLLTGLVSIGADQPGSFDFAANAVTFLNALNLTSGGAPVTFSLAGDVITGSTAGGPVILRLTLTDAGQLTVDLLHNIDHATISTEDARQFDIGSIIVVSDADGDALPPGLQVVIRIGDDIPTVTLALNQGVTVVVDETIGQNPGEAAVGLGQVTVLGATLFTATSSVGADNPGTATYSLVIVGGGLTGLFSTDNQAITLFDAGGGVIQGRYGVGNTVALQAVLSITDGDGDIARATVDLGGVVRFEDDAPTGIAPDHAELANGAGNPVVFELDQDGTVANNYGQDDPGTVRFLASLENSPSGMTSGGIPIIYHLSNGGLTLTGTANNISIFVITLDPTNGTYSVDMNGTVDVVTQINFSNGGYNFAGGNTEWNGFVPTGEALGGVTLNNNSQDLLLTPEINNVNDGTINTTANAGGVGGGGGGNNVGSGPETFRIDFVIDLAGDPHSVGGGDYDQLAKRDHTFDGHYTVNGATGIFASTTGSTVNFAAYDDPDGNNVVGDGAPDAITGVSIAFNAATQFFDLSAAGLQVYTNVSVGGQPFTVTELANGTVNISGVVTNAQVGVFTSTGYNSLEYTYVSGEAFQVGQFGASVQSTDPISFNVPIEIVDGDGDTVASAIGVTLSGAGEGYQNNAGAGAGVVAASTGPLPHIIGSDFDDTLTGNTAINVLFGNAGNDTISGGDGNDTLIGGIGTDTLTGGNGIDRMIFEEVGAANQDTINGYVGTGTNRDVIDISALLDANFSNGNTISNFVRVDGNGAGTAAVVQVDITGAGNFAASGNVASLTNYGTVGNIVTLFFEGAEHQVAVV